MHTLHFYAIPNFSAIITHTADRTVACCSVSFFGEGRPTHAHFTGFPFLSISGLQCPLHNTFLSWFFSLKADGTGMNHRRATAPLHFASDQGWVAKASLQLPSHHCTIMSQAPDFFTCLLCNSLDSSPTNTHLQTKNANALFAEILMDEKINTHTHPSFFVVAMVTGKELKHQSLPFPDDGLRKLLICFIKRQVVPLQLMLEGPS